jgi:hypothetical protein
VQSQNLERIIAEHLAEWDSAHVELAIYGCDNAKAIAQAIDDFCRREVGSPVADALFYQSSIGAVAGVLLVDGCRVVVKAHQPDWSRTRLKEIVRLQTYVASQTQLAPAVLAGPSSLGQGWGVIEAYADRGVTCDAHVPEVRRALAKSLYIISKVLEPFVDACTLSPHLLTSSSEEALWPTPHSQLFNFDITSAGAEDIDNLAAEARSRMMPCGRVVLGHGDWRAEHVRFEAMEPVVAFDWDGLCKDAEPALVGFTAHAFCADWSRSDYVQAPSLEEARAFVADYEEARGYSFERDERILCGACFAYSVAYTARCGHSIGQDERHQPGTFQHLIATHGSYLLNL